jgi:Cu/Ag efflux pump CusA
MMGAGLWEVMTMQIDNKIDNLSDNLWEEMTLMTAVVVILLGILWQFL